jgi:peptide/nickel transport system substrate-binding protein
MATNFESTTFDPTLWGNANGSIAGSSMYETLLTLDGDKKVASKLAESWDVSDDYRTCVFKLRKGVQFHHGYGELTAEDVVFTIERMSDPELGSLTASLLGVDNFESVSAPDAYTVEIRMKEADPGILIDFASWYSMIVSKKAVEELTPAQFGQNPVGTGPVEFVSGRIAEQYMVRRFEDYWGEGAALDGIQISTLPDETNAINAFEAGELDLISLDESTNIVKYMDDNEVTLINAPSFNVYFLGMNLQVEPFDDARVRHAISLAINRDELIEDYWQNTQLPTTSFVPNLCLYAVTDAWTPEYNVERAKELLAEAGYPDGFSTTVAAVNDTMSQGPMAVIQQYLAEIGVDLKMNASEYGTFITDVREGQQPMWFMARSSDFTVDRWLSSFLSSEYPGNNWGGYQDEEFDMLLHEAQIATEEDEKEALYRAAQLRLIEMMPAAPIAQTCSTTLMKKNVSGFERDASGYMLLYKMSLG